MRDSNASKELEISDALSLALPVVSSATKKLIEARDAALHAPPQSIPKYDEAKRFLRKGASLPVGTGKVVRLIDLKPITEEIRAYAPILGR